MNFICKKQLSKREIGELTYLIETWFPLIGDNHFRGWSDIPCKTSQKSKILHFRIKFKIIISSIPKRRDFQHYWFENKWQLTFDIDKLWSSVGNFLLLRWPECRILVTRFEKCKVCYLRMNEWMKRLFS